MKFSTRNDTNLPAEKMFAAVSDFARIERVLLRRGSQVRKLDDLPKPGVGSEWQIGFDWRGKPREARLKVSELTPPEHLGLTGTSDQFDIQISLTVVALAPTKSRLIVETDVTPRGMKARLMLQTAKLGKAQLDQKFAKRVKDIVDNLAVGAA